MQLLTLLALLPALALAAPAEQHIEARQNSVSVTTRTVTATKTVYACRQSSPAAVSSTSKSGAISSASSKAASSSSVSKAASSSSVSKAASSSSVSKAASSSSTSMSKATSTSTSSVAKAVSTSSSFSKAATSTSTSAAAATTSSGVSNADRDLFLKLHNDFRAQYSANAVTWNTTLAAYALKDAQTCKYGHTGGPYGENIAAGAGGGYSITSAFNSWANEASQYDYSNPGYSDATGHFTQIVWKSTNQIGCAAVTCPDGAIFTGYGPSLYVVCEYAPPGNIVGDNNQYFRDNVGAKTT